MKIQYYGETGVTDPYGNHSNYDKIIKEISSLAGVISEYQQERFVLRAIEIGMWCARSYVMSYLLPKAGIDRSDADAVARLVYDVDYYNNSTG